MKTYNIKNKALVILLLTVLTGVFSSCKKELENKLTNDTYADTYWKNEGDVRGAVLGAYGLFRKSMNTNSAFFIWGDTPVGLFNSDESTNTTLVYTSGSFVVPYREDGAHNWTNWYRVVDICNLIIENVNRMPDASFATGTKNSYLGEAYFLRGLSYFYMTRVWGDLPLQLTATTSADQTQYIGRTPAADILKQIKADAQKASALLTWESLNINERRRASKASAIALLAHASAWGNDNAATLLYTDSLISRADLLSLQPKGSIRQVFKTTSAPENIFVISAKDAENESSAWTNNTSAATVAFFTISNDYIENMPLRVPQYYPAPDKINTLYEAADTRKAEFFRLTFSVGAKPSFLKYADIVYKNPITKSEPRAESNLVVFRLADMILLKAEALAGLNRDGEAQTAVNLIRTRAGVNGLSSSGFNLRKDIILERQRELIGEGQNYFDIVRNSAKLASGGDNFYSLMPWGSTMNGDRFAQKGYLWPIHNSILNANRLISQNAWWMGKY
ncbi:MAG: RagB/SusD family nutrient uptake outer membrane protein [Bacteroidota bacterium]